MNVKNTQLSATHNTCVTKKSGFGTWSGACKVKTVRPTHVKVTRRLIIGDQELRETQPATALSDAFAVFGCPKRA